MKVITFEDVKRINETYLRLGTYAATARELGLSPATIKKYVQKDYVKEEDKVVERFNRPLPDFDPTIFRVKDWSSLCELTKEERAEVRDIWKELDL